MNTELLLFHILVSEDGLIIMRNFLFFGLVILFLAAPVLSGCKGSPSETPILPGGKILGINLEPENIELKLGSVIKFRAIGIFAGGVTYDLTSFVTWASSNSTIAFFLPDGTLVANTPGSVLVNANYNGTKSQTASIFVPGAPVGPGTPDVPVLRSIVVDPKFVAITEGESADFTCTGVFSDGSEEDYSSLVTWRISDTTKGILTPAGRFVSIEGFGVLSVSAKFGEFESNYAVLTINEAP